MIKVILNYSKLIKIILKLYKNYIKITLKL